MDREEALALFQDLTGANEVVAEHVLEAMQWDLDSSVNFFLESGSVGFGGATVASPASPPDLIEEPDYEEELPRQRLSSRTAQQPPRSSPIEILDDDDDDDIQVLASSLGRRRATRADMIVEGDQVHPVGSLEDELEGGAGGGGGQGRRVRRNRRRMAGEMDRDLELLGQRFGVMTERPQQQSHRSQQQQPQQSQQQGLVQGPATMNGGSGGGGGSGDDEDMPELPADVDLQEQQMLMAAIQGGGYEGQLPDFAADPRYQPRLLSPGAQARQTLREEQDAAYHDSLRADREKQDAAERSRLEAEAAAAQQAAAAEAEERQQREEAERLERELRSKAERLPPEPAADDPDSINLAVRLPAGGRCSRRFRRSDPLQAVFDFVDVQQNGSGDLQPGSYSLATSYPRRVLESSAAARSLADAGLSAKQEALFLEPK